MRVNTHFATNRPMVLLCAVLLAGCSSSPTRPTPPTAVVTIPTLSGQWTGSYTITNCTQTGAAALTSFCASIGGGGSHAFTPVQSGGNLTGTLGIGTFNLPVSGSVGTDRIVALSGSGPLVAGVTITLNAWRATLTGSSMAGTMTFTIVSDPPNIGSATVSATTALTR